MQVGLLLLAGCQLVDRDAVFDPDGDQHEWPEDCDSEDPDVYPGAVDTWYDGIDSDCDGASDFDADGDGYDTTAHGGTDCDDGDASIHPAAVEVCSDGVDDDCDGEAGDCAISGDQVEEVRTSWVSPFVDSEGLGSAMVLADANTDGTTDLLIGASAAAGGNGALYVVLGPITTVGAAVSAIHRTAGAPDSAAGLLLATGDADGDGIDDALVGGEGAAWLLHGPLISAELKDAAGTTGGLTPASLAILDGMVFIGDAGWDEVGVVFGFSGDGPFSPDSADVRIIGEDPGSLTGTSISNIGDFDDDGFSDLLVGAPGKSTAFDDSGKAYVVSGPITGDVILDDLGTQPAGESDGSRLGQTVAGVGDLNGDGKDDYALSAPGHTNGNTGDSGAVYVVYEGTFANIGDAGVRIVGAPDLFIGDELAAVGDVNIDGHADLLIGVPDADDGAGRALLLYGPLSGTIGPSEVGVEWKGEDGDALGASVAGGVDTSLDGVDDLFLGATGMSGTSGEVSLILGTGM